MRPDRFFLSLIHLLIVLFLFSVGLFLCILAKAPHVCHLIADFLLSDKMAMTAYITGASTFLLAIILMIGFQQLHNKKYYKLAMQGCKASIDEAIIKEYIQEYWSSLFKNKDITVDVLLAPKQKIEIMATLPPLQELGLLERIESELGVLLARKLGYEKEFLLTIVSG
jgi:hypothetical protein